MKIFFKSIVVFLCVSVFSPKNTCAMDYQYREEWRKCCSLMHSKGYVVDFCFSDDSKYLATCTWREITIWDVETGIIHRTIRLHNLVIFKVAWSRNGKFLAFSGGDFNENKHLVKIYSVESDSILKTFDGHRRKCLSLCFNSDDSYLAVSSCDDHYGNINGEFKIWNVATEQYVINCVCLRSITNILHLHGNRNFITHSYGGDFIKIWNVQNKQVKDINIGTNIQKIKTICFSPINSFFAAANFFGEILIIDNCDEDCRFMAKIKHSDSFSSIQDMKFDCYGNLLIVSNNKLSIFDVNSRFQRKVIYEFHPADSICNPVVYISRCGSLIARTYDAKADKIDIWKLEEPYFDDYDLNSVFWAINRKSNYKCSHRGREEQKCLKKKRRIGS